MKRKEIFERISAIYQEVKTTVDNPGNAPKLLRLRQEYQILLAGTLLGCEWTLDKKKGEYVLNLSGMYRPMLDHETYVGCAQPAIADSEVFTQFDCLKNTFTKGENIIADKEMSFFQYTTKKGSKEFLSIFDRQLTINDYISMHLNAIKWRKFIRNIMIATGAIVVGVITYSSILPFFRDRVDIEISRDIDMEIEEEVLEDDGEMTIDLEEKPLQDEVPAV